MTQSGRQEIIRRLAEDYAERAAVLSMKFEEAYTRYVKRCELMIVRMVYANYKGQGRRKTSTSPTNVTFLY